MAVKTKKYLRDNIASMIFTDKDCLSYVEAVISKAIGVDESIVKDNLILKSSRINSNINTEYSYVDAIYENNTSIINIEINYNNSNYFQEKNMKYICHLFLKQKEVGKKVKLKPIYQININNFDIFKDKEFLSRSYLIKEGTNKVRDKSICIIDINLAFLEELNYNKIKEEPNSLEYLLYFFVNDNKSELDKLYLEDEIMEKVQEKLYTLDEALDTFLYYDPEELKRAEIEDAKEEARKEGENKKAREIATIMLKEKIPINIIIKTTKLSQEEIESLKEN